MRDNCLSVRKVRMVEWFQEMERDRQTSGAAHDAKRIASDRLVPDPRDFASAFAIIYGDRLD